MHPVKLGLSGKGDIWYASLAATSRVGFLNGVVYAIAESPLYRATFHDVTTGDNSIDGITGFQAGRGWDAVTGWGSPIAVTPVPLLAASH